jgi:hypothetical protein
VVKATWIWSNTDQGLFASTSYKPRNGSKLVPKTSKNEKTFHSFNEQETQGEHCWEKQRSPGKSWHYAVLLAYDL